MVSRESYIKINTSHILDFLVNASEGLPVCRHEEKLFIHSVYLLEKRVTMTQNAGATGEHLEDVEDGCGCTEVWEHLSEQRDGD